MDKNIGIDEVGKWVDEQLAVLNAGANRSSDSTRAFERMKEKDRQAVGSSASRMWMTAAVTIVIGLVLVALPWKQLKHFVSGGETQTTKPSAYVEPEQTSALQPMRTTQAAAPVASILTSETAPQQSTEPSPDPAPKKVGGPGGATAPKCTMNAEPTYTDEARAAHIQGMVKAEAVVHKDGTVTVTKIVQALGYGLDEIAKATIEKSRCDPGKVDGQPVDVQIYVQVNFHLY